MPDHEDEFDKAKKLYDETFSHLKELYRHEISSHVIGRLTAIGGAVVTVVATVLGIVGYLGFTINLDKASQGLMKDLHDDLDNTRAVMEQQIVKVAEDQVDAALEKMREKGSTAEIQLGVLKKIGKDMEEDFRAVKTKMGGMLSKLEDARDRFVELEIELKNAEELNKLDTDSVETLVDRIKLARERLVANGENLHERTVLGRSVQQLGVREFKHKEDMEKRMVMKFLKGLLEKNPRKTGKGQEQVSLEAVSPPKDPYREARTQTFDALRRLASNPPEQETGVEYLKDILGGDGKYLDRHRAAWGLQILANESLLSELAGQYKKQKSGGKNDNKKILKQSITELVKAALDDEDGEVRSTAKETLREIVKTRVFKNLELDEELGGVRLKGSTGLNQELKKNYIEPQLENSNSRMKAAKVVAILGESGQSFWRKMLIAGVNPDYLKKDERINLLPDDEVEVKLFWAESLLQIDPLVALKVLKGIPLTKEVKRLLRVTRKWTVGALERRRKSSFEEGKWGESIAALQQIVQIQPDNQGQLRNLVELYLIGGEYDKANAFTNKLRNMSENSEKRALYDWFDAVTKALSGQEYEEEKDKLCKSAEKKPVKGWWRFTIFADFIKDNKGLLATKKTESEILDLISIAGGELKTC